MIDRHKEAEAAKKAGDSDLFNHHMKHYHQRIAWQSKDRSVKKIHQGYADNHHNAIKDKARQFNEEVIMPSEAAQQLLKFAQDKKPVEFGETFAQDMGQRVMTHIDAMREKAREEVFNFKAAEPSGDQ